MFMQLAQRMIIPLLILVLSSGYYLQVASGSGQDYLLIRPVFYCMAGMFCIILFNEWRALRKQHRSVYDPRSSGMSGPVILTIVATCLLIFVMDYIGFVASSMIYLFVVLMLFKVKDRVLLVNMPVSVSLALSLLFANVFSVPLPKGPWGF